MTQYKASVRLLDDGIGKILALPDRHNLCENTLVICTTDHGIPMPGIKCTLTDHGIGVMLIMKSPGGFSSRRVIDALVSHIDIFPTICDLILVVPPEWLQGKSMLPLVVSGAERINDEIYAEVNFHAAYEPMRAVRTQRWEYIYRFDQRQQTVLSNIDDSLSKDVWLKYGGQERAVATEQLYDLMADPNEVNNLAGHPEAASALHDMRKRLDEWMARTDDPLLNGALEPPVGVDLNSPDGISPAEPTQTIV